MNETKATINPRILMAASVQMQVTPLVREIADELFTGTRHESSDAKALAAIETWTAVLTIAQTEIKMARLILAARDSDSATA